ncbi:terminal uridylyltransferase Tailor-like isoform X2 [Daktulosphaira vitifoliae]|nr:terminal uridylyltransferase Tailor-like isoform X2 [Daktulosphaira vitifoliae]
MISLEIKNALYNSKLKHVTIDDVQPYGSRVSGLYIDDSDVDIHINCSSNLSPREMIQSIANVLRNDKKFYKVFALYYTKVPLIKCIHKHSGVDCDLSFNNMYAIYNTYLLKHYLTLNQCIKSVLIELKLWAKKYGLINTNGFSSYSFYWLGLFFMQVNGIIPTVCELQNSTSEFKVGYWNCAFSKEKQEDTKINKISVFNILDQMYTYYSNLDYETYVICPYLGRLLFISDFKNIENLPNELSKYKQFYEDNKKEQKLLFLGSSKFNMYVQDPFQHNYNICARVTPKIFYKFIDACKKTKSNLINEKLNKNIEIFDTKITKTTSTFVKKEKNYVIDSK